MGAFLTTVVNGLNELNVQPVVLLELSSRICYARYMNDAINTSSLVPFSENEAQLRRLAEADDATGFDELLKQTGQFDYGDAQRIIDDPDIYIHFRKDLAKRMASMSFEQYWKITHDEEKDHLIRGTHRVFRSSPPDSLTNILR